MKLFGLKPQRKRKKPDKPQDLGQAAEVVGWEVSVRHNTDLVAQAFLNALEHHPAPQIAHSDQGSEYRNQIYLNLLKSFNVQPSMSEKARPWQNGHKESFYSGFKLELGHPECYSTLGELIEAIAQQIYYYNNQRIHTALKGPPTIFAQRIAFQKLINKVEFNNLLIREVAKTQSV